MGRLFSGPGRGGGLRKEDSSSLGRLGPDNLVVEAGTVCLGKVLVCHESLKGEGLDCVWDGDLQVSKMTRDGRDIQEGRW